MLVGLGALFFVAVLSFFARPAIEIVQWFVMHVTDIAWSLGVPRPPKAILVALNILLVILFLPLVGWLIVSGALKRILKRVKIPYLNWISGALDQISKF